MNRMRLGTDLEGMSVTVKENDRYKGTLIIGSTGGGKTAGLLNIVQGDSYIPCAKIIIDPSGFFAKDAYSVLNGKADYCSIEHPIGINPMLSPYKPYHIAQMISETINQVVTLTTPNERFTVKMRKILDPEIVRCIELGRTSLESVMANIEAQKGHAETRDGIIARLSFLLSDPEFKEIICGDGFEINHLIQNQKTLIVDCSGMSYEKQIFMGTIVTNLVKNYFMFSKPREYKPLVLLIDEAHLYVSNEFTIITKQARKYKIATILSTTDFSMMPKPLVHSLLSNAGTILCLKAGYVEASMISREIRGFQVADIQGLEKYHALYKTPDGEGIVKLPRPVFTREIPIKTMKKETKKGLKWFPIDPAYSFHFSTTDNGFAGVG